MTISDELKHAKDNFFHTCIADIFRAIEGDCLLGAFTLTVCGIGALSNLANVAKGSPESKDNVIYKQWVEEWIKNKLNSSCDPAVLYAYRCALVHTHGSASAFTKLGLNAFVMTHDQVHLHWVKQVITGPNDAPTLNLESLVAEFTIAAFNFFDEVKVSMGHESATEKELKNLIAGLHFEGSTATAREVDKRLYGEKHKSLRLFDDTTVPAISSIENEIHSLYIPIGRCECGTDATEILFGDLGSGSGA